MIEPKNMVVSSVQILGVRLLKIDATGPTHGLVLKDKPAMIDIRSNSRLVAPPSGDGTFIAIAEFQIALAPEGTKDSFFVMNVHFELVYKMPPEQEYSEDEMKEFFDW